MNVWRWRHGDKGLKSIPVSAETVIECGDLLYLADDITAHPASDWPRTGDDDRDGVRFCDRFAGVAMEASRHGSTTQVILATTGIFEFLCAPAVITAGKYIGVDMLDEALLNQVVKPVDDRTAAIGRCYATIDPAGTRVLVDIVSTVSHGGVR